MKRKALMIGLFVVGGLILAALAIAFLGGNRLFEHRTRAIVYFTNSVKGLYIGAPVTFRGVPIGQVENIGIELNPGTLVTRIPVELTLTPRLLQLSGSDNGDQRQMVQLLVQRGLRAKLTQQSLVTGQTLIDLDFVTDAPPPVTTLTAKGVVQIPVMKGQFDDLVEQIVELPLQDTVQDLRRTLATLNTTLGTAGRVIERVADDWQQTTVVARDLVRQTDQTLNLVGTQTQQTMRSVQQLSDTTRQLVQTSQPDVTQALVSTRQAAMAAETSFKALADISAPGSAPREDLETALRDLSQTARSLRQVAEVIENQPNALIFGRTN